MSFRAYIAGRLVPEHFLLLLGLSAHHFPEMLVGGRLRLFTLEIKSLFRSGSFPCTDGGRQDDSIPPDDWRRPASPGNLCLPLDVFGRRPPLGQPIALGYACGLWPAEHGPVVIPSSKTGQPAARKHDHKTLGTQGNSPQEFMRDLLDRRRCWPRTRKQIRILRIFVLAGQPSGNLTADYADTRGSLRQDSPYRPQDTYQVAGRHLSRAFCRNTVIYLEANACPACGSRKLSLGRIRKRTVVDLKFSRNGVKRWVTQYVTGEE